MVGHRGVTGAIAFVVAGMVVLAAVASEGADATRQLLRTSAVDRTAYQCLEEGFRAAVPEGSRVLLRTPAPNDEAYQRIVDSTYPDYDFVDRRADAELVVHARFGDECKPRIRIERLDRERGSP